MILIVGLLTAFGPLCIDMYLPALPRIGDDLHASASAVQLSLTACLVGLALGQLIIGPISDRIGRRRPLFAGLCAFILASAACTIAPGIASLVALRFVQGFGGAAGLVIAGAIVRDQYSGTTAARFFSLLLLVTGTGPILAPQIGAELLHLGSWRVMFLTLAAMGMVLIGIALVWLPETLPSEKRSTGGLVSTLRAMRAVGTDRRFLGNALACGFAFGALFAYIAGSSFALENVYGLSPQRFSLIFALNAVGMIAASQVNGRVVARVGSAPLLNGGLVVLALGGVGLLVFVLTHTATLGAVLACMFLMMTSVGFIGPNATALALNDFPQSAGSAAALLGLLQFSIGAGLAPLVGVGGPSNVLPMAIVMAACAVLAIGVRVALRPMPVGAVSAGATVLVSEAAGSE